MWTNPHGRAVLHALTSTCGWSIPPVSARSTLLAANSGVRGSPVPLGATRAFEIIEVLATIGWRELVTKARADQPHLGRVQIVYGKHVAGACDGGPQGAWPAPWDLLERPSRAAAIACSVTGPSAATTRRSLRSGVQRMRVDRVISIDPIFLYCDTPHWPNRRRWHGCGTSSPPTRLGNLLTGPGGNAAKPALALTGRPQSGGRKYADGGCLVELASAYWLPRSYQQRWRVRSEVPTRAHRCYDRNHCACYRRQKSCSWSWIQLRTPHRRAVATLAKKRFWYTARK